MKTIALILTALVALEHFYILLLEMFAWTTKGPKVFSSIDPDLFEKTKVMAANQGLYNGFLGTGLVWSFMIKDDIWSKNVALFFLSCVIVAGIYGGLSVHKSVFIKQALPAILALTFMLLS